MTRVLSGAALVAIAVGVVWFAPPAVFFAVAEVLLLLAFVEYSRLASGCGLLIPVLASGAATSRNTTSGANQTTPMASRTRTAPLRTRVTGAPRQAAMRIADCGLRT